MNYSLMPQGQGAGQAGLGSYSLLNPRPERMPNMSLYANPADRPQLNMGPQGFAEYAPMIQAALSGMGGGQQQQPMPQTGPVHVGRQYRPQAQGDMRQHFYGGLGGH